MMEGDLEIKNCEYNVGEVNLLKWENILKHNKKNIGLSMLEVSKSRLHHYNITAKKLIFMLCSVILGLPN